MAAAAVLNAAMHGTRTITWVGLALSLVACGKARPDRPLAASASAAPAAPSTPEPAEKTGTLRAAPPDLEIAAVEKRLGCSGKRGHQACRVLADFARAERWPADPPSGKGRWVGNAYRIEKGVEKRELLILYAERVPTAQVPAGDLPVKVATGPVPDELQLHGTKLVNALARGDVVTKKNRALPYVESFASKNDRGAINSAGKSVRLISDENVYLRQQGTHRLYLVQTKSGPADEPGDGIYAELWLAAW